MTPDVAKRLRYEQEIQIRNKPWSDEELDAMLPPTGYKIMEPPPGYVPNRTQQSKLLSTPSLIDATPEGFSIASTPNIDEYGVPVAHDNSELPYIKPEDYQYFGKLMEDVDEDALPIEEMKERKIMKLLLKVKSGTPPQRKTAFRVITERAKDFGASALFNQILPLLLSPAIEDQERHLLVKVIDRILYKLGDLVRPYVHKILVVIEPLLIDEDYFARVEGREIISNLAKAAGLATMIGAMRPDIDHVDEYVRNTTARAFAVVASALGIPALLPFLKAVCQSKKSWQARHTGIKIVQQVSILMGCSVLPHLMQLVEIIEHGLEDEQQKVRTITGLAVAALAEAAYPYGIESFDSVLPSLWNGAKVHRGKTLAAFLKAIGFIIPLMEPDHASRYTRDVMPVLRREFQSADEEMKRIVLKTVEQCVSTDGVSPDFIEMDILPDFVKHFWVRRMALDRRNSKLVAEATSAIANKVGCSPILALIVNHLKDESEPYRKMVMQSIETIIQNLGTASIDEDMEQNLISGLVFAFQEQTSEDTNLILSGFGTVVNALGVRCKPYIPQIVQMIKWRLGNASHVIRMQAADLVSRIAPVMRLCEEEKWLASLGITLFEYLGEEYPEVLGSILGGLKSIVNVIGMTKMEPPIKDLLPRLTPILKNRHEKVQENVIDLVGRIADRGAEFVNPREWMRISFELLEMLKAQKKAIRRASVNTFGYIARAIGPQDVIHILLNNLKVQERQLRLCTTIAIAIVAETCGPFTVLPALMNEYRLPEMNVQNGVLKTLSFLFEYIGVMSKDYVYAITPLLEHGLIDKDVIHRQTACAAVKHLSIGVSSLNCEDALTHLMNYVWPNIFETIPHTIFACIEAIEGMMVGMGVPRVMQYVLQGLFHPARRVREVYWKIYNQTYIYGAESMIMGLPCIQNEGQNTYEQTYFDLHI
jgi:splicing factor 3B subunit 1